MSLNLLPVEATGRLEVEDAVTGDRGHLVDRPVDGGPALRIDFANT